MLTVRVELESITSCLWYEMRHEDGCHLPAFSALNAVECCVCQDDLSNEPHIKCLECERNEVYLCCKVVIL